MADSNPTAGATPLARAVEGSHNLTLKNMRWVKNDKVIKRFIPPSQQHFPIPSLFEQAYAYADEDSDDETRQLKRKFIGKVQDDELERKALWRTSGIRGRPVRSPLDPERNLATKLNMYLDASKDHLKHLLECDANPPKPCTLTGGCNCNHLRPACRRTYGPPVRNNSDESTEGET